MISVSLWRVLKAAWLNFWRNIWLSLATVMIMTITLLMLSFLYFANVIGAELLRSVERKVDLSLTFKEDVSDDYIRALGRELEARDDVESVRIVTSEEALDIFRRNSAGDPILEESLRILGENPLPANMFILATDPSHYEEIARHLHTEAYQDTIAEINLEKSRVVIERLITITQTIERVSLLVTITFSFLVMLIMFSTVRLAIYSFREEIDIMRLVGASRWFIQGPFLVESIAVALLGVSISSLITFSITNTFSTNIQQYFFGQPEAAFNLHGYAHAHWFQIIGLQLLFACTLALFSTYLGIRRYLRR